jgi:hypothetical protein
VFFRRVAGEVGVWERLADLPTLKLQDPFVCRIDGALIVGGRVKERPDGSIGYHTQFYRTSDLLFRTGGRGSPE